MKRINLIYVAVALVFYFILQINWSYARHSVTFYGFAENKETEINLDRAIHVENVYVTSGQNVSEGDLLMEVTRASLGQKKDDIDFDIEEIQARNQEQRQRLRDEIRLLEQRRALKVGSIESEIRELQAEIDLNQSLLKDLKSIKISEADQENSPSQIKMKALKEELATAVKPIDLEIEQIQKEISSIDRPAQIRIQKLESEKDFIEKEQERLSIFAPSDGLIGNVRCKKGEHISSFNTLISFYERNPTLVKGYVHESLILHVDVGDTLAITSTLHENHTGYGEVVGLGYRMVEIPERLRKRPEFKTYGREVMIKIPADNPFLQKEKVVLNLINTEGIPTDFYFPFFKNRPTPSNSEAINVIK